MVLFVREGKAIELSSANLDEELLLELARSIQALVPE